MTERIFETAEQLINGDRQRTYGDATAEYERVAMIWSGLLREKLREPITAKESLLMMSALKIQREVHQYAADNLVDGAGYMALADRCSIHADNTKVSGVSLMGSDNSFVIGDSVYFKLPHDDSEQYRTGTFISYTSDREGCWILDVVTATPYRVTRVRHADR